MGSRSTVIKDFKNFISNFEVFYYIQLYQFGQISEIHYIEL